MFFKGDLDTTQRGLNWKCRVPKLRIFPVIMTIIRHLDSHNHLQLPIYVGARGWLSQFSSTFTLTKMGTVFGMNSVLIWLICLSRLLSTIALLFKNYTTHSHYHAFKGHYYRIIIYLNAFDETPETMQI